MPDLYLKDFENYFNYFRCFQRPFFIKMNVKTFHLVSGAGI